MLGKIHSIESMGLVDGPGIRAVVFMQGCFLRCKYCHNPDMWELSGGKEYTPEQLVKKLLTFKTYFDASGGGVTFSGGEPLLQPQFLLETLRLLKEVGIHTCLDTSGVGFGDYTEILKYTDLVLLDIKHFTPKGYKAVTGQDIDRFNLFLEQVQALGVPIWIRHVVVPELTDGDEHILKLAEYLKGIKNIEKVELLGYHLLGREKYPPLNIEYPLSVPPLKKEELEHYQEIIDRELKGE